MALLAEGGKRIAKGRGGSLNRPRGNDGWLGD
jgi:hypothetical protein